MEMWRQKGGERIAVSDMGGSNLQNAHRMMVRLLSVLMEPLRSRCLSVVRDGYFARAWNYLRWVEVLAKECYDRELDTLEDPPAEANLITEPAFNTVDHDYKFVSDMADDTVLEWYRDLFRAARTALDYATHGWPTSDAASDAFESELRVALEMDKKATNWLPLFAGEVDRRGLPAGDMEVSE